ncbi:MAG: lactonase family protein, partial [Trebonia sp.]
MEAVRHSLIIGTYASDAEPPDERPSGVLAASYDGAGLAGLAAVGLTAAARLPSPSWVTATADGRCLYAVAETTDFEDRPGGGVGAYARDPGSGAVTLLNKVSSGGSEPAHAGLDPSERFVVVANYGSGSVSVFAREADGRLGAMTGHVQHQGSSVHPDRQVGPHPHQICFDPVTGDLLVPDLGVDAVFVYRLGEDGGLTERRAARITASPGAGPRHAAFHPGGQYLFVVNELDSTLVAWRRESGGFTRADVTSTLPDGFTGHNQVSAVRVTASGRSVLTANRGHDSLAVFSFDPGTGKLAPALIAPSGGREPRDFVFTPDGARLLVANQGSDTVVLFDFDEERAWLRFVSGTMVPAPT